MIAIKTARIAPVKNAKNFSSNFGISEVTTLSKNPLTPA
jgi:hypothetical protein